MFQKPCNLARAATYYKGGGGGGSNIKVPGFKQVLKGVTSGFPSVARTYRNFAGNEDYLNQQQPILGELGRYGMEASKQFQELPGQMLGTANQYLDVMKGLMPTAQTGKLTQDQTNEAIQTARQASQARGDLMSNPAMFAEAMNRQKYADARQAAAISQIEGLGASALGQQSGAMGVAQGAEQLLGYPSEQLTKGELGRVGAFSTLIAPEYGLAGDQLKALVGGETASAGNAQASSSNKTSTILGIVGAAATAY